MTNKPRFPWLIGDRRGGPLLGPKGGGGTTDGDLLLEPPGTDSLLLESGDKLILESS